MTGTISSSPSSAPSSVGHPISTVATTKSKAGKTVVTPGKVPGQYQVGRRKIASYVEDNSMHYINPNRLDDVEMQIEDGFDKLAADWLKAALPVVAGTVGSMAVIGGINSGIESYKRHKLQGKADESLRRAIMSSPKLQGYGYETLKQYMPMIIKASPTVAEEPLLLANYLESLLDAEGHMNLATFAELAGIEGTILKNNDYRYGVRKEMMKGVGKGVVDVGSKAFSNIASDKGWFGHTKSNP